MKRDEVETLVGTEIVNHFNSWFDENFETISLPYIDDEIVFDGIFDLPGQIKYPVYGIFDLPWVMWFVLYEQFMADNGILCEIGTIFQDPPKYTSFVGYAGGNQISDEFKTLNEAKKWAFREMSELYLKKDEK